MLQKTSVCLLLALTSCSSNQVETYKNYIASWSPDGKQILFYSDRNGNWDVFMIGVDGRDFRQITTSQANETEPNWHPSLNTFVFASDKNGDRKIHLYDLGTNTSRQMSDLPGKHSSPVWSPAATHLAYLIQESEQWKLVVSSLADSTI